MRNDNIAAYLATYAESEHRLIDFDVIAETDAVIVIPAYRESPEFLRRLLQTSLTDVPKALLVLVSNHPDNLIETESQRAMEHHQDLLDVLDTPSWENQHLSYHSHQSLDVLLVSRVGPRALDHRQSTGLARKIGADIALALIHAGKCSSDWIHNTDADVLLPRDYFCPSKTTRTATAALLFPFMHVGDESPALRATQIYEQKLHQYQQGLASAGSPYAFHTLGSATAVDAKFYAAVRGFPRRNAGEDFYLINKLAKLGKIETLKSPVLEIQVRCSDRVPFGTGPKVSKLVESENPEKIPMFYSPRVFEALGILISTTEKSLHPNSIEKLPSEIRSALECLKIESFLRHVERQGLAGEQYRQHFHTWFDGFQTLKFIHYLRDNYYPNISYAELSKR